MVWETEWAETLRFDDAVSFDPAILAGLYRQLGPTAAENVIVRAMEEMSVRLLALDNLPADGPTVHLVKGARGLSAIADQVGMLTLARVAKDVARCAANRDAAALAATRARLARVGDRSLLEVWDVQNLSG